MSRSVSYYHCGAGEYLSNPLFWDMKHCRLV